jgi:hypothetical protein
MAQLDDARFGSLCVILLLILQAGSARHVRAAEPAFSTETIRGWVVFHHEAFQEQTGVRSVPEAGERLLALKTDAGKLIPLLEDVRGRAFRSDERLRKMRVELVVRRYTTSPLVQVIHVFELSDGKRYEIDYWCEICAIAVFEQKDCECCQGPVELRRRKVD